MIPDLPDTIETPAVLIDETIARRNVETYQAYCAKNGLALRPHIKTHKLPHFAGMQMVAGAVGITCQKLSEAEAMADSGLEDILITYNILGPVKLARLRRLAGRTPRLSVTADNAETIKGLSDAFADRGALLAVLIECNTGANRCGVGSPREALDLARLVANSAGLTFEGLMTYPAVGGGAAVEAFMAEAKGLLISAGIDCPIISSGGSPDMWSAGSVAGVTEYRIGTYIYNDRSLVERGACSYDDCALAVVTRVVSTPAPGRAIVDAGSKVLTSDLLGLTGYGHVLGHDDVSVTGLSEEHGTLEWSGDRKFKVGETVRIIPNHCCVVSNMVDYVWIRGEDGKIDQVPVAARGGVT